MAIMEIEATGRLGRYSDMVKSTSVMQVRGQPASQPAPKVPSAGHGRKLLKREGAMLDINEVDKVTPANSLRFVHFLTFPSCLRC
jgi:hypothetical protein